MKKGLMVLLASVFLAVFAVSMGLACEPITPAQMEPKVYSLQEFLDSIYVYRAEEEDFGVTSYLAGSDNPIEITVESPFEVRIGTFFEEARLTAELFKSYHGYIEDKEKKETYAVFNFSIEISDRGFTLPKDDFWRGEFSDLQRKLIEAALNRGSVKIKGYIDGWGYQTNLKEKFFYNICFRLRVTEIQELPDAGE